MGCHAVIDGIGKNTLDISINSLAQRGIFVSFGNASGAVPAFPPLRFINKSGFLTRPKLNDYTVTREELMSRANDIYGWLAKGDMNVTVSTSHSRPVNIFPHRYPDPYPRGASLPMRSTSVAIVVTHAQTTNTLNSRLRLRDAAAGF